MGDFLTLTEILTYDKSNFLAIEFHEAMSGIGFDEPSMTEILISRSNQELEEMGTAYSQSNELFNNWFRNDCSLVRYADYGLTLTGAIASEVSGSLRDLYTLLAQVISPRIVTCVSHLSAINSAAETKARQLM